MDSTCNLSERMKGKGKTIKTEKGEGRKESETDITAEGGALVKVKQLQNKRNPVGRDSKREKASVWRARTGVDLK